MKIDYISDAHLDFYIVNQDDRWKNTKKLLKFFSDLKLFGGDVLIVAGDIGHYNKQNLKFLKHAKTIYKHVICVLGNHDHYLITKTIQRKYKLKSENRTSEFKQMCVDNDIHLLDGTVIDIEGVKFGGFCGWWDKSYFNYLTNTNASDQTVLLYYDVNDSKYILDGSRATYRLLGNTFRYMTSFDPFAKFQREYDKLKNITEVDVMISHFSPCVPPNMNPKYVNDYTSTFYYFDGMSEVNRLRPKYWIFGHTHTDYNFKKYETNFLCNPVGYPGEKHSVCKSFML